MRRAAAAVVCAFGAASLTAGCAAERESTPAPASHGGFADCLHANGVPAGTGPAVAGPPAGVDPATWERAMSACSTGAPGPAAP